MSYDFSIQLRRGVLARCSTAVTGDSVDSPSDEPQQQSAAGSEPTGDCRLLTDGGDSASETDDSEGEGADEEMQPPEQEGEAGVEQDEAAEADEAKPEEEAGDEELQPPEQEGDAGAEAEAEHPEEPTAAADEAETKTEAEEPEAADEPEQEAEGETVDVPQSDVESVGTEEDESTTVLFLDIYGLDLDLLGLEIELHQVVLDVFATEGDGNLLGNLLSAVAGLTDPGGLSELVPDGLSAVVPEGGLSGLVPGGDSIKNGLGIGGGEGEEEAEGAEGGGSEESEGIVSSAASSLRESIPDLPIKQLLIEIIAGVIRQLLEPSEKQSGEEAAGEGS